MNNVSSQYADIPKYVDRTRTASQDVKIQQRALESQANAQEQQVRDRAAQDNGLLESRPAKIVSPSPETVNQLQKLSSQKYPDNANGLGRTAIQTYGQFAEQQSQSSLSSKVQVDVSV